MLSGFSVASSAWLSLIYFLVLLFSNRCQFLQKQNNNQRPSLPYSNGSVPSFNIFRYSSYTNSRCHSLPVSSRTIPNSVRCLTDVATVGQVPPTQFWLPRKSPGSLMPPRHPDGPEPSWLFPSARNAGHSGPARIEPAMDPGQRP